MNVRLPTSEIRKRLSRVDFLAPLSEAQLDDFVRVVSFVRLGRGEALGGEKNR
jgi:hypothetical protein